MCFIYTCKHALKHSNTISLANFIIRIFMLQIAMYQFKVKITKTYYNEIAVNDFLSEEDGIVLKLLEHDWSDKLIFVLYLCPYGHIYRMHIKKHVSVNNYKA